MNAVWDLTSHDLSIFDFLLDSLPEAVSCVGSNQLDPEIEDTTYTTFKYSNSILAHAHASWLNPRKVRQITVIGSKKWCFGMILTLSIPSRFTIPPSDWIKPTSRIHLLRIALATTGRRDPSIGQRQ